MPPPKARARSPLKFQAQQEDARERARLVYPRSAHFEAAYVRGAIGALLGHRRSSCPYKPDRNKTWVNAYRNAWLRGYDST